MENRRVVITGMGAVTPLGNSAAETWSSAVKGVCGVAAICGFEEERLPVTVAAQVKDFDPVAAGLKQKDLRHYDLFSQYALVAAREAIGESGLACGENIDPYRLGVYIGSCIGGMNTLVSQTKVYLEEGASAVSPLFTPMLISNIAGGNIAIMVGASGPVLASNSACATGTNTIGEAYLAIRYGRADAILAGGAEAAIHPLSIGGFASCRALSRSDDPLAASLPFDARRGGFVMADGAGVLVLEELEHARARGARIIAEVVGYGHTCDAYHYTAPRPDGQACAQALRQALQEAGYRSGEKVYVNAHGTGTALNDRSETLALKLAFGEDEARTIRISSTKSMTGHMLGAAGAVEAMFCACALRDGIIPPTIGLSVPDPECDLDYTPLDAVRFNADIAISNSMGFGGHNACIALRTYYG